MSRTVGTRRPATAERPGTIRDSAGRCHRDRRRLRSSDRRSARRTRAVPVFFMNPFDSLESKRSSKLRAASTGSLAIDGRERLRHAIEARPAERPANRTGLSISAQDVTHSNTLKGSVPPGHAARVPSGLMPRACSALRLSRRVPQRVGGTDGRIGRCPQEQPAPLSGLEYIQKERVTFILNEFFRSKRGTKRGTSN
jgi:hypothetical protein